ncbi:hypothetical protein ACFY5J_25125 [Peribacillus butanolivorans]
MMLKKIVDEFKTIKECLEVFAPEPDYVFWIFHYDCYFIRS